MKSKVRPVSDLNYLSKIEIDQTNLPFVSPEIEQERKVAIFDLLEENSFKIEKRGNKSPPEGPYHLFVGDQNGRVVFKLSTEEGTEFTEFHLSLTPLKQTIKAYFKICDLYFDAVKQHSRARIETIDMARRGVHDEGAALLQERLEGKVTMDKATSRRLFTLVCVLQAQR